MKQLLRQRQLLSTREAAAQPKRKPIVAQGIDRGWQENTKNLGTKNETYRARATRANKHSLLATCRRLKQGRRSRRREACPRNVHFFWIFVVPRRRRGGGRCRGAPTRLRASDSAHLFQIVGGDDYSRHLYPLAQNRVNAKMPAALFVVFLYSFSALSLSASLDCDLLSPAAAWPAAGGQFGPRTIAGTMYDAVDVFFDDRTFVAAGGFTFEISSGTSNTACVFFCGG